MSKDYINVYWSPSVSFEITGYDWGFLYPKPKTLFNSTVDHLNLRNKEFESKRFRTSQIASCPAVSTKFKKIIVFESPLSCSYKYDFSTFLQNGEYTLEPTTTEHITSGIYRNPFLDYGPSIGFSLGFFLFAEESIDTYFTPPMFHPPKYMKYGSCIPGEFDIGNWFRPFNFEVQFWNNSGEFHLEEKEPLFYTEFRTDKKIILKRFNITNNLAKASDACVESYNLFGRNQSLEERYERFNNTDMRDFILSEIKKNVVDESAPLEI